jgi:hypothetical protein
MVNDFETTFHNMERRPALAEARWTLSEPFEARARLMKPSSHPSLQLTV